MKVNGYEIKPYAYLKGADLRFADLRGADLRYANLEDADLEGANLEYANLWCADLKNADLVGANLKNADLDGAIVTGTILEKKEEPQESTSLSQKVKELEEELKKYKDTIEALKVLLND